MGENAVLTSSSYLNPFKKKKNQGKRDEKPACTIIEQGQ